MFKSFSRICILILLGAISSLWALAVTNGTPIGGMGTGYIVFNAKDGNFSASGKIPPPASSGVAEYSNKKSTSCGFHFFVDDTARMKAITDNEDAKCPLYTADFGDLRSVNFKLNGFGPFIPGEGAVKAQLAQSPLAYFEITATNKGAAAANVAVALEFTNQSSSISGLLGGANTGTNDAAANNKALTYAGTGNTGNAYLQVDCDGATPVYGAGAVGSFATTGVVTNGDGNLVSAKCSIPAGATVHFKFVFSWWRTFISTTDRYSTGKPDSDNYYYHNFYADSKAAGQFGMAHFNEVKSAVLGMVTRVMGSNFPDWYKDRLLNNLYPLIHNSNCAKDGRVAFWEGRYGIIGTVDQGQHASLWYSFNWPSVEWRELHFWLSTSHTGTGETANLAGQIHHDFNTGVSSFSDNTPAPHFMCPWNNYLRNDYWWIPNTTDWSDLNSMILFKAYELMLATGNRDSLRAYWPLIKRTANRILVQCADAGASSHLPTKSKSTYDSQGTLTPEYASGSALTAWLSVIEMAKFLGEDSVATRFQNWYNLAREEYKTQFNSSYATGRDYCEGDVAGYSWAHYFGLPAIQDSGFITTALSRLYTYYSKQSSTRAKLGKWHFYTYDHWGGAAIATGQQDTAMTVHKWDYDYYYTASPKYVFWQDLESSNTYYASYMTAPCVWRSYFQMTGFLLDNANNRLWVRPSIPTSMGKKITNAPLVNPYGWGTLNYDENKDGNRFQDINVAFDTLVTVKSIVLKNNTGVATPYLVIKNNGAAITGAVVTAEDSVFEKRIRVTLASPIQVGPQGLSIKVYDNSNVGTMEGIGTTDPNLKNSIRFGRLSAGARLSYSVSKPGRVTMDLIGLNGAKLGRILDADVCAGAHSFVWNGKSTGSAIASGAVIVKLTTPAGSISKIATIGR